MTVSNDARLTVEDLRAAGLDDRFDAIEEAVGAHLEGSNANVAVISEPFAGRDVLLDYAEEFLGAATRRITLTDVVRDELPDLDTHEVILIDNCQYLYTREVGGFAVLDPFLETIAASDAMFVTSWNRYAWDYLDAVREIERYFPTQIVIPELEAEAVTDLLNSHYGPDLPEFVETGEGGRVKTIDFGTHSIPLWGEYSLDVPVPELNLEYVTFRFLNDVEEDTQAVVYQKIAQLSKGDPGVATALWERSVRDGQIAPAYVEEVDQSLDLDDDAAFVLEIVVSKERITREQLDRITETEPIDQPLQHLLQQGVVTVEREPPTDEPWTGSGGENGDQEEDELVLDADVLAELDAAGVESALPEDHDADGLGAAIVEGIAGASGDGEDGSSEAVIGEGDAESLEAAIVERLDAERLDDDTAARIDTEGLAPEVVEHIEREVGDETESERDVVRIVPERLHSAVRHLRGRQLIW